MTIKQYGGVFGRNPTFNNVTIEGTLTFDGDIDINSDLTISGNLYLPDNSKAIFGNNDDLQIYHDGTDSIIEDVGTGNLDIKTNGTYILLRNTDGNNLAYFETGGGSHLYWNGASGLGRKLQTTATGIDVTGSVTADGLTVDGLAAISSTTPELRMFETDTTDLNTQLRSGVGKFEIKTLNDAVTLATKRFELDHATGDISFYNTAGNSQALFWDSSASALGLGTTTPTQLLNLESATSPAILITDTTNTTSLLLRSQNNTSTVGTSSNHPLVFETNATEVMRLDASGNVNLYGTDNRPLAITSFATASAGAGWDLDATSSNGVVTVSTGGTEAMRIDSSGNVGIGEDNPSGLLHLTGDTNSNGAELFLQVNNNNTTDNLGAIHFGNNIDATLNTILGGTSGANNSSYLTFSTSNAGTLSEALLIDSSQNLLVGTTTTSSTSIGVKILPSGRLTLVTADSGTQYPVTFGRETTGAVGSISTTASATAYNTSSDQRLKENIADADDAGSKIDAIQVRKFDWKADGSHQDYGMVAQELQVVAPEAVSGDADSEEMMGVDYSKLVPMMLKEIQSLRARVAQLES